MGSNTSKDTTESPTKVPDDFSALLNDNRFSDVTLIAEISQFSAHKAILAARSSVFAAMFGNEIQEKLHKCVSLPDISDPVMAETLRYVYTNQVNNLQTLNKDLLVVADKYMFDGLKSMCIDSLKKSLRSENVIEILRLAVTYDIKDLKMCAMENIRENAKSVITTADFKNLKSSAPDLLEELYCDLAMNHTAIMKR